MPTTDVPVTDKAKVVTMPAKKELAPSIGR